MGFRLVVHSLIVQDDIRPPEHPRWNVYAGDIAVISRVPHQVDIVPPLQNTGGNDTIFVTWVMKGQNPISRKAGIWLLNKFECILIRENNLKFYNYGARIMECAQQPGHFQTLFAYMEMTFVTWR